MVYPFARHVSERGYGHPDGFPVQLELKTERFGMALRSSLACAFVRPESEQNSSHPPACTAAKVERWIDCPVPRQSARRSEAGGPRPGLHHGLRRQRQRFTRGGTGGRTTCSAELTMLSPFASTHSKVAEQQVIRTFVTAPIHFGCHRSPNKHLRTPFHPGSLRVAPPFPARSSAVFYQRTFGVVLNLSSACPTPSVVVMKNPAPSNSSDRRRVMVSLPFVACRIDMLSLKGQSNG